MQPESEVLGLCMQMCPAEEMRLREIQRMVHPLEAIYLPHQKPTLNRRADKPRMVKAYRRPAAGSAVPVDHPTLLRPFPVLMDTINYLNNVVINDESYSWRLRYEFVVDRLRSVRQDAVVQRIPTNLNNTLMFAALPLYFMTKYRCEIEECNTFDWRLHQDQLEETLNRLHPLFHSPVEQTLIQCLYSAFIPHSLNQLIINRPDYNEIEQFDLWKLGVKMIHCIRSRIFVTYFKLLPLLPYELRLSASVHVAKMRHEALNILTCGYSCKGSYFPISLLTKWLRFRSVDDLSLCCEDMNILLTESGVQFVKLKSFEAMSLPKLNQPHWIRCEFDDSKDT